MSAGATCASAYRSEEHTSELQSRRYLHSFPTRRSSDLCAKPEVLQLDQDRNRKTVVNRRVLDVRGRDLRFGIRLGARGAPARIRQVEAPAALVLDRLSRAFDLDE